MVDQVALVDALRNKRIAGAALDVMAVEPVPAGDPLLTLDNVTLTPHIGSASIATRTRMADLAVENILAYFEGRVPPTCLNPEVLSRR
jgi:lactate dehydrogenase-like 2-hydroxyacid dehydrogenase